MSYWQMDDLTPAEATLLVRTLSDARDVVSEHAPAGVYLQARVGAVTLSEALLDLALILYGHVVLVTDGAGLADSPALLSRAVAYADAGRLTPVALESYGALGFQSADRSDADEPFYDVPRELSRRTLNFSAIIKAAVPDSKLPFVKLVDEIACFEMSSTIATSSEDTLIDAMKATRRGGPSFDRLVRSLCGDQLLAYVFGSDTMPRQSLADLAIALARPVESDNDLRLAAVGSGLHEWYRRTTDGLPRFDDPRVVLALSDDLTDGSFRQTVARLAQESAASARSFDSILADAEQSLDRLLRKARVLGSDRSRRAELMVPGAMATVGALMGGPFGAVIGGAGATVLPLVMDHLRRTTPVWTSFFVRC